MAGDRSQGNPQSSSHPRMAAGLPSGPGGQQGQGGGQSGGQGGMGETLRQAASSMGETLGNVREQAQDLASEAVSRLEGAWESARGGVTQGASAVAERAENLWAETQNLIRRYPVAAVAVAFFVGCLTPACLRATFGFGTDDIAEGMSRASE